MSRGPQTRTQSTLKPNLESFLIYHLHILKNKSLETETEKFIRQAFNKFQCSVALKFCQNTKNCLSHKGIKIFN